MYTFTKEIRDRLKPFLEEYVNFEDKAYLNYSLTVSAVKQGVEILCNQGVFTVEELSKQVMIECNVILPVCVINEILGVIE